MRSLCRSIRSTKSRNRRKAHTREGCPEPFPQRRERPRTVPPSARRRRAPPGTASVFLENFGRLLRRRGAIQAIAFHFAKKHLEALDAIQHEPAGYGRRLQQIDKQNMQRAAARRKIAREMEVNVTRNVKPMISPNRKGIPPSRQKWAASRIPWARKQQC